MSEMVIDEEKETGGFGAEEPGAEGRLVDIVVEEMKSESP
jgi:hypothetical protein